MKLFIFIFLIIASSVYPLSYDSAIYKAQKGNWQDAHNALNSIITNNPDSADAMYDAGVVAYNVGNKCQAATCFKRAAECSGDKNICFRAHFNAGNMYVGEKNLKAALEEYNKALAIEPDNEYAKHNRDRVAEMLKEEEKKEEQQNKDNQQDQDQKDQEDQDKQQDKQKQEQNEQNQNQDGNDQQSGEQKNQQGNDSSSSAKASDFAKASSDRSADRQKNDSSNDGLDEKTQRDQGSEGADGRDQTQRKDHGDNKKEEQKNSGKNEKRNNKDELDKQSQNAQKEGKEQQGDKHGTTPKQANVSEHNKSNVSADDGQEQAIADPWLLKILENQEQHDKAINKQLMEAKIRQHGGKNGQQNCW